MNKTFISNLCSLFSALLAGLFLIGLQSFGTLSLQAQEKDIADEELLDEEALEEEEPAAAPVIDEKVWKAQRDKIFKDIEKYVTDVANKKFTEERTAKIIIFLIMRNINHKKLGDFSQLKGTNWNGKIRKAPKNIQKIVSDINDQIDKLVAVEFPAERKKDFAKEAEEKYRMYKMNEKVTVQRRGGYGANTRVSGIYNGRNTERIRISQVFITRLDLTPEDEARFYEDANVKLVDSYRRQQEEIFDAKAQSYREALRIKLLPPAFLKNGYVPNPQKKGASIRTSKKDFWMDKRKLLTTVQNFLKNEAKKKLRAVETPKRMAAAKFILAKNMEDKEEWMPQVVADEILKKKQEAAEAAAGEGGGEGAAPGAAPGTAPGQPAGAAPGQPAGAASAPKPQPKG